MDNARCKKQLIMKNKILFILGISTLLGLGSCAHQPIVPDSPLVSFSKDVQPIILGNCTQSGCHSAESRRKPFLTYNDVMRDTKAGNALGSTMYQRISNRGTSNIMPPNKPLAEENIQLIYIWIMQGAKNN